MKQTLFLSLVAQLLAATPLYAATVCPPRSPSPTPLTLEDAQAIALQNHPSISAQQFRARASREGVNETQADLYPQIYGSANRVFAGSNTRVTAPPGAINDPTIIGRGALGISVTQLVTDFGRQSDLIASSELALRSEEDKVDAVRDSVLFRATAAYYDVLRAQSLLQVAAAAFKSRSTLYDQVTRLQSAKLKSDLDVSFAKLGVDQASLLQLRAQNNLDDAWARLGEALGLSSAGQYTLAENHESVVLPLGTRDDAVNMALARNPEIQAIEASRDASHKTADADAKAGNPVISVGGFAGINPIRDPAQKLSQDYAAGGVVITIPLFTGGRLTARERRSALSASAADRDVDAARNTLAREVQVAWDLTQTAYRNIAVIGQLLQSSTKALELIRARYDIGLSSIVEVEQAEVNALEAQIAESNAKYDYLAERAFLDFRIGGNAIGSHSRP